MFCKLPQFSVLRSTSLSSSRKFQSPQKITYQPRQFSTQTEFVVGSIPVDNVKDRVQLVVEEKSVVPPKPIDTSKWTRDYFDAPVINFQKQIVSNIKLDSTVFGERIRPDIIHRVLVHKLKDIRSTVPIKATKRSVDVNGSTRKISAQKGRGRARHSTKKAPQFRGGGKSHGRKVRDITLNTPTKVLKLGFRSALSSKYAEGKIVIVDKLSTEDYSTMKLRNKLDKLGWPYANMLFVDFPVIEPKFFSSTRRIQNLLVMKAYQCNIWDILRREYIVMTPNAVEEITRIFKP